MISIRLALRIQVKHPRNYRESKAFKYNWFSGGAVVIVMTLSSIYFFDLNRRWCNKGIATVLHVYFDESVIFDAYSMPLKIKVGDTVFFINDFQKINVYNLRFRPQQIDFVLMTNNNQVLSSDTLYFNGAERVHFMVYSGARSAKAPTIESDLFEFYPL